jgi:hypothetical protein
MQHSITLLLGHIALTAWRCVLGYLMKLAEKMARVCKAIIKAKYGYFEESQIYFDMFNTFLVTS